MCALSRPEASAETASIAATAHASSLILSNLYAILQHLAGGVITWRAHNSAAGVRSGAAQIQPFHRRAVSRVAGHRAHDEHLIETHLAVEDVAAGDAVAALHVERREHLLVYNDRPNIGAVLFDEFHHAAVERLTRVVPSGAAQGVRRVLQEDPHDVLAGGRERRVVHRRNG